MIKNPFPGLSTGGFPESAAAFSPFAPAPERVETAGGSGESRPPSESDLEAISLWRAYRAAQARAVELHREYDVAHASLPWTFRAGPKFIGLNLPEKDAAEHSGWPAIAGVAPPTHGRINIRPNMEDLYKAYHAALACEPRTGPDGRETDNEHEDRILGEFSASVAALVTRMKAKREACRAAGLERLGIAWAANDDARRNLRYEILALRCEGPHALAAVTLLRWEDEKEDWESQHDGFFRAVLAGLRRDLTGEIAEDVAKALAKEDGGE